MLYKTCPKCNNKITYELKYCEVCQVIHDNESLMHKSNSNKYYNTEIRDKERSDFYHNISWTRLAEQCKKNFFYLDIYSYYYENKIEYGDISHHIEELEKNDKRKLDINNLIYLTQSHHNHIHAMYKKNYGGMKQILFNLVERWNKEMSSDGRII